jgi:uncharacterized membrane protein YedE/YeeE
MLVMGGGVAFNLLTLRYLAVTRGSSFPPFLEAVTEPGAPLKSMSVHIPYGPRCPANRVVDWKLLVGSVSFGVGWGITGICPGPGIVDFVSGAPHFGVTVPAIVVGMGIFEALVASRVL